MKEYIFPLIIAWILATANLCFLWCDREITIENKEEGLYFSSTKMGIARVIASLIVYGLTIYILSKY